jgi:hypothetical protein
MRPLSDFFGALDKGVEKVSDLAFEAAVRRQKGGSQFEEASPRQKVLILVDQNRPEEASKEELDAAVAAELVEPRGAGRYDLTSLGRYVLPDFADEFKGEDSIEHEQVSSAPTP